MAAAIVGATLVACGGGGGERRSVIDGRPRVPDAEGVVTAVTLERLTLDGDRRYEVRHDLESFSAYDGSASPLLHKRGQYVQVGLEDGKVAWIAAIGVPLGEPSYVYYSGAVARSGAGRLYFKGGTVVRMAGDVRAPTAGADVEAVIDPRRRVAVAVRALRAESIAGG